MERRIALVVLGGILGLAGPAAGDETTFCNAFITTLPYTISTQGHYCFNKNLSTAITTGNAITINVDFVVLDLNNFKLGGGSAGLGTEAVGIFADGHRNITIRNGNIRGFKYGIRIRDDAASSGGHVIENNVVEGNTHYGIECHGDSVVIRNNLVANIGGSTVPTNPWSYGIYSYTTGSTPGATVVRDNVITNVFFEPAAGGNSWGIAGATVSDHNVVTMGSVGAGSDAFGIWGDVCRDNTVFNTTGTDYSCTLVGANHP